MKKPIVYIDMDGVMCDFYSAKKQALINNPAQPFPQSNYGFYSNLPRINGFQPSDLYYLFDLGYDVNILTRPSVMNLNCYTEKASWVLKHLGQFFVDRLYMAPDKSRLIGDYLIDDDSWEDFNGTVIQYGSSNYSTWLHVINFLENEMIMRKNENTEF